MADAKRVKPRAKYGRLIADRVLLEARDHRKSIWRVECQCGRSDTRTAAALLSGQTTQCTACVREAQRPVARRWSFPCTPNALACVKAMRERDGEVA